MKNTCIIVSLLLLGLTSESSCVEAKALRSQLRSRLQEPAVDDDFEPAPKTTLTLINADTDQDVGVMTNRYLILLQNIPRFTMRCNPDPAFPTKSVKFLVNDTVVRIEHKAPFALNGNKGTNYFPWKPVAEEGFTDFVCIPYSGDNATGNAGEAAKISAYVRFP